MHIAHIPSTARCRAKKMPGDPFGRLDHRASKLFDDSMGNVAHLPHKWQIRAGIYPPQPPALTSTSRLRQRLAVTLTDAERCALEVADLLTAYGVNATCEGIRIAFQAVGEELPR